MSDLAKLNNLKYSHLLYKRGYLLSQAEVEPPIPTWIKKAVGDYYIYFDPDNEWGFAQKGNSWVALLGKAVDILHWSLDINFITRTCLERLILSEDKLLDYIDYLSGRFILIYHHYSRTKLMTDAFGTRSAFYSLRNPVMVASHYKIISDYKELGESKSMEAIRHDPRWKSHLARAYPGNLTPIEKVYILTPNTLINFEEQKIQRFYPRRDLPLGSLDEVVEKVSDLLKRQIELLSSHYKLAISLSAGIDSRVTLAAVKDKVQDVLFFTYGEVPATSESYFFPHVTRIDALIARDIVKFFSLNHIFLENMADEGDEDFRDFNKILSRNTYYVYGRNLAKAYLEQLPSGLLHIRSNISEIGRAHYQRAGFELPITPVRMARGWKHMENNELAVQTFREFAEVTSFDSIMNYDPYDMFYWEHRMGTWHSLVVLESDAAFDTHVLFNCRVVAEKMLSVSIDKRIKAEMHRNIIRTLWPQLLYWPINEPPFRLQLESLQAESKKLKAALESRANRIEKLGSDLKGLQIKVRGLEEEREQLRNRIITIQGQFTHRLNSLRNSPRYLIGDVIASAADDPRKLFVLPLKLWRIYTQYRHKNNENAKETDQLSAGIHPPITTVAENKATSDFIAANIETVNAKKNVSENSCSARKVRLLFMPTNGAGLGHVTRLLAIARRLKSYPGIAEIIFVTTSDSLNLFTKEGFTAYHFPSAQQTKDALTTREWNTSVSKLLKMIITNHKIDGFIFDGVFPYAGIRNVIKENTRLRAVWIRRGLNKQNINDRLPDADNCFDLQIVPGELGQNTVTVESPMNITVPPIIYLDKRELLSRDEVMNFLELDPSKKTVFVQMGAGNINEIVTQIEVITDVASQFDNVQIVVAESVIAANELRCLRGIRIIRDYPLSRYYLGFDVAISAAGYNTFAELMHFGIPSIFIPNLETESDDQLVRAMISERAGTGLVVHDFSAAKIKEYLTLLLDDSTNAEFRARCLSMFSVNGSDSAAELLAKFFQNVNTGRKNEMLSDM